MKKSGIWVYEYDPASKSHKCEIDIKEVRYVLGEVFNASIPRVLICIGINPSTAVPGYLDQTLLRVQKYAKEAVSQDAPNEKLYGAWYMLNIYPQRSTDPGGIDKSDNKRRHLIHKHNLGSIKELLDSLQDGADVWCAWGRNIEKRDSEFLQQYMLEILRLLRETKKNIRLLSCTPTIEGHPSHPLDSRKGLSRELKPLTGWWQDKLLADMYSEFVDNK